MTITPQISDGDIVLDKDYRPHWLEDKPKLIQDLSHIILTPRGDNIFHPQYGSDVPLRLGYPITFRLTAENLKRAVVEALAYFKQIQTKQGIYQDVVPEESLRDLNASHIFRVTMNQEFDSMAAIAVDFPLPDRVRIRIAVITEAYEEVIIPFHVYLVPRGPIAQAGTDSVRFARYDVGDIWDGGFIYK